MSELKNPKEHGCYWLGDEVFLAYRMPDKTYGIHRLNDREDYRLCGDGKLWPMEWQDQEWVVRSQPSDWTVEDMRLLTKRQQEQHEIDRRNYEGSRWNIYNLRLLSRCGKTKGRPRSRRERFYEERCLDINILHLLLQYAKTKERMGPDQKGFMINKFLRLFSAASSFCVDLHCGTCGACYFRIELAKVFRHGREAIVYGLIDLSIKDLLDIPKWRETLSSVLEALDSRVRNAVLLGWAARYDMEVRFEIPDVLEYMEDEVVRQRRDQNCHQ